MEQPEVVTLCGSVRFAAEHQAAHTRLSLEGRVVLLPALPVPDEELLPDDIRRRVTVLSTDRLVLRLWAEDDIERLAEIFADPRVWWFPSKRGLRRDETESFLERRLEEWRQNGWGHWAVEHDGVLIGYTGFALPTFLPEVMPVPEIGWRLHPTWWGRGLATEAASAALAHGFTHLGFAEVVSIYEPENAASGRVMERLGMALDRETVHPHDGIPLRVYRLEAQRWRGQPGSE